ncbi:hypothetical protein J0910_11290 [Nocardiopsis sp. CNT-189]|uniref:FitA-like ribbon-helix-helix domain-containing protein n=1 Tax=Nocardiopsis oceanisediminis TaxID=2816862 RepID=UPI003B329133
MAVIHVRDVPEETLETLKRRAARSGQSLQAYVLRVLVGEAETLSSEEAAERARALASGTSVTAADVTDALAAMREERGT